jgi:hypothetical protein
MLNDEELKSISNDFLVTWKNKIINKTSEATYTSKNIIYIPQSYLNKISDDNEMKSPIDELIENILKEENSDIFNRLEESKREIEKNISN